MALSCRPVLRRRHEVQGLLGTPPACGSYERSLRLHDIFENGRGAQHAAGADRTPRQLTVLLDELVEVEQVLVETEHVGDRRCQRVARTPADGAGEGIDAELAAPLC
jgi:hypothetical protein